MNLASPLTPSLPSALRLGACVLLAGALWGAAASAQAQGIYTCVDAKGRRITSDRPIVECLDREQHKLGNTGIVRQVVPPSYTADERARLENKQRAENEIKARAAEEKRRERALLIRYPNQAVHDKERAEALSQIDDVIAAVNKREAALVQQRKEVDAEMEFYQSDPSKAPFWLRRKLEDSEKQMVVQKRFLEEQAQEKLRINQRFDEELGKLRQLWSPSAAASNAATIKR
ncbi:MAG: DUF4124 domain-containing protein [Hydrogenophaga sp.]|jgi:hypothetical protein|uniref:DUF4124 domain-containing protein n=1 Tax=Hydrogenophaga sp. TaxID=1904254 RepID=UPI0027213F25|nr:DUF4124 domain-containing protein [Hydrogenophaga sp.]MDO8887191.1 DUF4124 domain-containing protein [Hydrogenophaga sp.]MDP1780445.1 DUF4124 domain-containing protein [Hydrogenophaga sp.]MDP2252420.1 DUF4124 domain-containing protein [Hydrogenophaga sp.]MDZ4126602.1 DUF4124 domain-containing protein [Hydrogenophaga sp.]